MTIKDDIAAQKNYITELRRYFHAHPEISLKEFETAKRIEKELDAIGVAHERVGETGVFAKIVGKGEGAHHVVALRADMDALGMQDLKTCEYASKNEGVCHACGHDAHTATLLGAVRVLKAHENDFSGEIRLFFQQAEEIGQGARQFIAAGHLDGVDRIFGAHVASYLPVGKISVTPGPLNASCDFFRVTIKGKGAHVSKPHLGVDALYVAAQTVVALQSIVSRSTNPLDTVVVGVGKAWAGTQYNIVAEDAVLEGTTRTFTPEVREKTNGRVVKIAEDTAEMFGAKADVFFDSYSSPLINNETAAREIQAVAREIVGEDGLITNLPKSLGAEDFADYLTHVKGCFVQVGTQSAKAGTASAHHNGHFDVDEEGLMLSCELYVKYALWVLAQETLA